MDELIFYVAGAVTMIAAVEAGPLFKLMRARWQARRLMAHMGN